MSTSPCPTSLELVAFQVGDLPEAALQAVASHLESCERCLALAKSLDGTTDQVLARMRRVGQAVGPNLQGGPWPSDKVRLDRIYESLHLGEGSAPPAPSPLDVAFLSPPLGPDEMGWLGQYRVLRLLGRGGMGMVFLAEDRHLNRRVALKVLKPELVSELDARQRFLREARAIAALRNDHIVTIYQVGQENGVPFLVMELLEGASLDQWLDAGNRPAPVMILRLARQTAEGLAAAHEAGLIHRDIKPANLWLETGKGGDFSTARVKILDFGLARNLSDAHITQHGYIMGTPGYMAPEQAAGKPVDVRSDLFSLGSVLYRLATGLPPHPGIDVLSMLTSLISTNPRPVAEVNPDLPPRLAELIMQMLAREPAHRPANAREVAAELEAIESQLGGAPVARPLPVAIAVTPVMAVPMALPINPADAMVVTPKGGHLTEVVSPMLARPAAAATKDPTRVLSAIPPAPASGKRRLSPSLLAGGLLAAVLLIAAVFFGIGPRPNGPNSSKQTTQAATPAKKVVPDEDDVWRKKVAALPMAQQVEAVKSKLKELNPNFDPNSFFWEADQDAVARVVIQNTDVRDLTPLRAFPKLLNLSLAGLLNEPNLAPLQPMELNLLDLSGTPVKDLSPLAGMNVKALQCNRTQVTDLKPLQGMPLAALFLTDTAVSDLSPLADMKIQHLNITGSRVKDLRPIAKLPVVILNCGKTGISTLEPLRGMKLRTLECGETDVQDLSPLQGMELLALTCEKTNVKDLSPLQGMPLEKLDITQTKVTDLSPLKTLPLRTLLFDFQPQRDTAILRGIKTLLTINGLPAADALK